jgi:DNA polymerase I-like protein with 3'-5' exonuclease and polymerase domains
MWHSSIQDELKRTRVLTNLLGRKHRFLDRWGDELFRSAYSYKPQSTIGDLLNVALHKVYESLPDLPFEMVVLLQLHDALYVMVEEQNVEATLLHLRKCMLIPLIYMNEEFIIDAEFKVKDSWAEGVEVDRNWRE